MNLKEILYQKFSRSLLFLQRRYQSLQICSSKDIFDEDLFEENILMPKLEIFQTPGKLKEIYDKDLGLDILLYDD
jgi:hypothetical protein